MGSTKTAGGLGLRFQGVADQTVLPESGRRPPKLEAGPITRIVAFTAFSFTFGLTALGQRVIGTSASSILQGSIELARHALSERQRQQCLDETRLPAEAGDIVTHRLQLNNNFLDQ